MTSSVWHVVFSSVPSFLCAEGQDYELFNELQSFPVGSINEATLEFSVNVIDDDIFETAQSFTVTISSTETNVEAQNSTVSVGIISDESKCIGVGLQARAIRQGLGLEFG